MVLESDSVHIQLAGPAGRACIDLYENRAVFGGMVGEEERRIRIVLISASWNGLILSPTFL